MANWKVEVRRVGTNSGDYIDVEAADADGARAAAVVAAQERDGGEWEPVDGGTWQQSA